MVPPPLDFCTYTKGGYAGTGVPGQLLTANFSSLNPSPLRIGVEAADPIHDAEWNVLSDLQTYLSDQRGGPGALTADSLNATSTGGGTLASQVATLTLNVDLGIHNVGGTPTVGGTLIGTLGLCKLTAGSIIGSWTLTQAEADALNAKTVADVLSDANNIISTSVAVTATDYGTYDHLNQLVTALNESFDNCTGSAFGLAYLCQE